MVMKVNENMMVSLMKHDGETSICTNQVDWC